MERLWLKKIRKKENLSQQDVANALNISRQHYGFIESGKRDPSVSVAMKLAVLFKFNWTLLFNDLEVERNEMLL